MQLTSWEKNEILRQIEKVHACKDSIRMICQKHADEKIAAEIEVEWSKQLLKLRRKLGVKYV